MDFSINRQSNVNSEMSYEEVKVRVRTAVEDYFKLRLGRPDIINLVGENIVVFDFRGALYFVLHNSLFSAFYNLFPKRTKYIYFYLDI